MTEITIHNVDGMKRLIQSVISFSSDARLEVGPDGVRIALKCDVPDKMRIEFVTNLATADDVVNLYIKDLQRLYRGMDLALSENIEGNPGITMTLSDAKDFLIYENGSLQFKIGLSSERAIAGCVDTDRFQMLSDVYNFKLKQERIKSLFRQSAIVRSAEARVYLVNVSGEEIAAKIEDEENRGAGMVSIKIADRLDFGVFTPIIIKAEMFKCLMKFPYEECVFHYTDKKAVIVEAEYAEGKDHTIHTRILFAPKKPRNTR